MRFADVIRFALSALYQHKVRTGLTTLGVVIGTFVLVLSLAIGEGVQEAAVRQFRRDDQLRNVVVWSSWGKPEAQIPADKLQIKGKMSPAKRRRLREAVLEYWNRTAARGPQVALTDERVKKLAALEHVTAVTPEVRLAGRGFLGDRSEPITGAGTAPGDPTVEGRLVAGRAPSHDEPRAVLVTEFLLYRWGIADDEEVRRVPGRKLRVEFRGGNPPGLLLALLKVRTPDMTAAQEQVLRKAVKQLPAALEHLDLEPGERETLQKLLKQPPPPPGQNSAEVVVVEEFTIAGVVRNLARADVKNRWLGHYLDEDVLLPLGTARRMFLQMPYARDNGFPRANLTVDREENVREVVGQIAALGLEHFALVDIVERVRLTVLLISSAMAFLAMVALLVAVLGIINTMLMTVLERTHEIGVMKAVGARDGHIQLIFLVEGACIGLVGGALGLLFSWLASFPGDAMARSIMEKQTQAAVEETLFAFPLWLTVGMPLFAGLLTTLAAVLPARRAARVSPITALRHE